MAGNYNGTNARCPYYKSEDPKAKVIICEGIVPGSSSVTHQFPTKAAFRAQVINFCDDSYWRCEYCCALDGYWKDAE